MGSELAALYLSLRDFVEPLRRRLESPEGLEHLFHRYGWIAPLEQPEFDRFHQVSGLTTPLGDFLETTDRLGEKLDADPEAGLDALSASDVVELGEAATPLVGALAAFDASSLSGLAQPLDSEEFWESIGEHVLDDLLEEYLRIYRPGIFLVLRTWRVLRYEPTRPEGPFRRPYVRRSVDWDQAVAMVKAPMPALRAAYHWADPAAPFDHEGALQALGSVLRAVGVPARPITPVFERGTPFPPDPGHRIQEDASGLRAILLRSISGIDQTFYKVGFELYPATAGGDINASGLMAKPLLQGGAGQVLPLGSLSLQWSVAADVGSTVGFALFPDGGDIVGGEEAIGTRVELMSAQAEPRYLLGNSHTAHIALSGFSISASIEGSAADPEIKLRLAAIGKQGEAGCKAVIPLGDADEVVKGVVRKDSIEFSFPGDIVWSSKTGLTFVGRSTLDIDLPLLIDVGPVKLTEASVGIGTGPEKDGKATLASRVTADAQVGLGPVTLVVEGFGFALELARRTRDHVVESPNGDDGRPATTFGDVDVSYGFVHPLGVGLAIDAEVVRGGGFLRREPDGQGYAGALELVAGEIGVKAVGLLGDRPRGWSLLLALYGQFPPIQLPYGFTLNRVGGLIALHHGVDIDALVAGMRTQAFDDVLFPRDPVANASRVINRLRGLFPEQRGALTIGPMVDVGWGRPRRILFARLAFLAQLDGALGAGSLQLSRIVLVGTVRVEVGASGDAPDRAVVRLVVDVLGFWDRDARRYGFLSRLRESRVGPVDVAGELGVWGDYGDHPSFVLAAGGFNPRFKDLPPGMSGTLDRLGASFSVGRFDLSLKGYFALTPGTIQAGVDANANGKIGPVGIRARFAFDALVTLQPYTHFIVDFEVRADVTYKGRSLAGVAVRGTIEGPGLWHITGKVSFSILWWDISKSFDETWGRRPQVATEATDVRALIAAELASDSSWSTQLPAGGAAMVTLGPPPGERATLAHPLGRLVVTQRVAPLGLELARFGSGSVSGPRRFDVVSARVGSDGLGKPPMVREHFAHSQFVDVPEEDRLSRPSFEEMDAGVEFSSGSFRIPARRVSADLDYEPTRYLGEEDEPPRDHGPGGLVLDHFLIERLAELGAAGRAPARADERIRSGFAPGIELSPSPLAAVDRDTLSESQPLERSESVVELLAEQRIAADVDSQLVEEFELVGG